MSNGASTAASEAAVDDLVAQTAGVRAAAILDPRGRLLAASDDRAWPEAVEAVWGAAAVQGKPDVVQVHVATDHGELFAVRSPEGTAVSVTERFALASLAFCDLRAALRTILSSEEAA